MTEFLKVILIYIVGYLKRKFILKYFKFQLTMFRDLVDTSSWRFLADFDSLCPQNTQTQTHTTSSIYQIIPRYLRV